MAQDIKTAFFDIDGTLTSFVTHVVPQSTVDALHALQRNGVKVFICSGRAPSYMGVVLDTIPGKRLRVFQSHERRIGTHVEQSRQDRAENRRA